MNYELEYYQLNKFMKKYNVWKGIGKGVVSVALFGIPVLLQVLPSDTLNITLGGVLVVLLNYCKIKYGNL